MREHVVFENGEKVIEVRSPGGKLLYRKTSRGYEMKCPRTKKICVVNYDQMLFDCLRCFSQTDDERKVEQAVSAVKKIVAQTVNLSA